MILTGAAIADAVRDGDIVIDPYDPARLNPNSCNYRLGPEMVQVVGPADGSESVEHVRSPSSTAGTCCARRTCISATPPNASAAGGM